jgi:riboflavin transporter FmnP
MTQPRTNPCLFVRCREETSVSMKLRTDSKSIAILAIFTSIIVALEVFPVLGVTDILVLPSPRFTIDWTGIPLILIFLGLGFLATMISMVIMIIAILYRNPIGAVFKGFAELFTLLGLLLGYLILRKREVSKPTRWAVYIVMGVVLRTVGMFFMNILLLPALLPVFYDLNGAIIASAIIVPLNAIQAVINIVGGIVFYNLIPKNLKITAGLGEFYEPSKTIRELPAEEIEEP